MGLSGFGVGWVWLWKLVTPCPLLSLPPRQTLCKESTSAGRLRPTIFPLWISKKTDKILILKRKIVTKLAFWITSEASAPNQQFFTFLSKKQIFQFFCRSYETSFYRGPYKTKFPRRLATVSEFPFLLPQLFAHSHAIQFRFHHIALHHNIL